MKVLAALLALIPSAWAQPLLPGLAAPFQLQSPNTMLGQLTAPQGYNRLGCHGGNMSPELIWKHAPGGTQSFAVTIFDTDARNGTGFWHWVAYNIPATVTQLPQNAAAHMPKGALQTSNGFGTIGYGGPCPPKGETHHYRITLSALDVAKLPLPKDATPAHANEIIGQHTLANTVLTVTAARP